MKLGIIIYSNDAETVWNAFRLGHFFLKQGNIVKVFLLGKGVECEKIFNDKFNVKEQITIFIDNGGKIFSCKTCLEQRNMDGTAVCPASTMKDLYEIIKESDKIISF